AQSRRLVWRIWREARAEALSHRRRSRPRVVKRRRAHMKETTLMRVRIVVADQSEARFYDTEGLHGPLQPAGQLSDPKARLHDRDLESDRPGRVFDHAPLAAGRRGAVGHHGTEGERSPRKHEAVNLARQIADQLEAARREGQFD